MFQYEEEGWQSVVSLFRNDLDLPLLHVISHDKKHALSAVMADGVEIGIQWTETKVEFILYNVSLEKGEKVQKLIGEKIKTGQGTMINGHFVFSCDLQELDSCREPLHLCSL